MKNHFKIGIVALILTIAAPLFAQLANSFVFDVTGKTFLDQLPDVDDGDENSLLSHDIAKLDAFSKIVNPTLQSVQVRFPSNFNPPIDPFLDVLLRPPRA